MTTLSPDTKNELLATLYALHEEWLAPMRLACKKGCSTCCTQSVTITGLEGRKIIEYLDQHKRLPELSGILKKRQPPQQTTPPITTNAFAEYCLKGIEPEEPVHEEWDFTPCPFLHDNCCTIYPARPFGCRAFISTANCSETGSAEIEPLAITINTVFTQLVEHLAYGDKWGKMLDILDCYHPHEQPRTAEPPESRLRDAKRLPGLVACEEEKKTITALLGGIMAKSINNEPTKTILGLTGIL